MGKMLTKMNEKIKITKNLECEFKHLNMQICNLLKREMQMDKGTC